MKNIFFIFLILTTFSNGSVFASEPIKIGGSLASTGKYHDTLQEKAQYSFTLSNWEEEGML